MKYFFELNDHKTHDSVNSTNSAFSSAFSDFPPHPKKIGILPKTLISKADGTPLLLLGRDVAQVEYYLNVTDNRVVAIVNDQQKFSYGLLEFMGRYNDDSMTHRVLTSDEIDMLTLFAKHLNAIDTMEKSFMRQVSINDIEPLALFCISVENYINDHRYALDVAICTLLLEYKDIAEVWYEYARNINM